MLGRISSEPWDKIFTLSFVWFIVTQKQKEKRANNAIYKPLII